MYNKISILSQGKPNMTAVLNAPYYANFAKVVYSFWLGKEMEELVGGMKTKFPNIELVQNEMPTIPEGTYNAFNIYYQVCSTLAGLERIDTEFVVKTRSDEKYTNLDPVIESLKRYPEKIVCHNVFFRPDKVHKFHCSDHFMAGKTDYIRRGYQIAKLKCEHKLPLIRINEDHTHHGAPEQVIHMSILEAKGVELVLENSRQIVMDNYELVQVSDLGDYIVRSNMHDCTYTPGNFPVILDNCRAIKSWDYF